MSGALFNNMKIIKIGRLEVNLEGAKKMKKASIISFYNKIGYDGEAVYSEIQKHLKPKKKDVDSEDV